MPISSLNLKQDYSPVTLFESSVFSEHTESADIKMRICIMQLKVTPIRGVNPILRFCNQRRRTAAVKTNLMNPAVPLSYIPSLLIPVLSAAVIYFLISRNLQS